jgi:hypothetical protein
MELIRKGYLIESSYCISFIFWHLSSGYSCSICSYTDTHLHHTHVHLTHTTCIQPDLQLYIDTKTRPWRDHQRQQGSVGDGCVAVPLWLHAFERLQLKYQHGNKSRWEHQCRTTRDLNAGGQRAHRQRMPTELELVLIFPSFNSTRHWHILIVRPCNLQPWPHMM